MSNRPHHPLLRESAAPPPSDRPTTSRGFFGWLGLLLKGSLWLLLIAILAGSGAGGYYAYQLYHDLQRDLEEDFSNITDLAEVQKNEISRIIDRDGNVLKEFFLQERRHVPMTDIPKSMIEATIAVEDARFYHHTGVDLYRIFGSAWKNIKAGRTVEGASTITQQLVKNLLLLDEVYVEDEQGRTVYRRSYMRKLRELLLAQEVERHLSKDKILELYLNGIYYGHGCYGVQAASQRYFGKPIIDATLAECALLAGLPKAPNNYSPLRHPERARERRNIVLGRMLAVGFISEDDYEVAAAAPVIKKQEEAEQVTEDDLAPYFVEAIRLWLMESFPDKTVNRGGFSVYTGLDPSMQRAAERALTAGLRRVDEEIGWRGVLGRNAKRGENLGNVASHVDELAFPGSIHVATVTGFDEDTILVEVEGISAQIEEDHWDWARVDLGEDILEGDEVLVEVRSLTRDDATDEDEDAAPEPLPWDALQAGLEEGSLAWSLRLTQEPRVEGALVALDAKTGDIRAWVGGYDFEKSRFNRVNQARRQPGSAFKTVVYTAAMASGMNPASVVEEIPIVIDQANPRKLVSSYEVEREEAEERRRKLWKPGNYSGTLHGSVTLREAFKKSYNVTAIQVLDEVGVDRTIGYARLMGVESDIPRNLTIALGTPELTLLELTGSYTIFPSLGMYVEPRMVSRVHDSDGTLLHLEDTRVRRVVDEQTAFLTRTLLESVVQGGTGYKARRLGKPLGGKTGTTNDYKDSWFMGFSPELVCGVYVGYDQPQSMGRNHSGTGAALPIWVDFMEEALKDRRTPFQLPEHVGNAMVCPGSGLLATRRCPDPQREFFRSGATPTQYCPVHTGKSTGNLMKELLSRTGAPARTEEPTDAEETDLFTSD